VERRWSLVVGRWSLVVSKRRKETLIANWPLRCCFRRSVWFGVRRDCGFALRAFFGKNSGSLGLSGRLKTAIY
jgi:hypothetical protein